MLDFSENFTSNFNLPKRDTTHPLGKHSSYSISSGNLYHCNQCNGIVCEYLVIILNDTKHDSHAVHKFEHVMFNFLRKTWELTIHEAIKITDGCSGQFKYRTSFAEDFGFSVERNFFASRHGKNDSDGRARVVKSAVRCAITGRAIIESAQDMFQYLKGKLTLGSNALDGHCSHVRCTFLFVTAEEIMWNKSHCTSVRPLPGTRKQHCMRGNGPNKILWWNLSCYCPHCGAQDTERCVNIDYTSPWEEHNLNRVRRQRRNQAPPEAPCARSPMSPSSPAPGHAGSPRAATVAPFCWDHAVLSCHWSAKIYSFRTSRHSSCDCFSHSMPSSKST